MRVVSPRGSKVAYFQRNGILHTAPIVDMRLDLSQTIVVDYFDDTIDWQEAMVALEMLEGYDDTRELD